MAFYELNYQEAHLGEIEKIVLEFIDPSSKEGGAIESYIDVILLKWEVDLEGFREKSQGERNKFWADNVSSALGHLAGKLGWNEEGFHEVAAQIALSNYRLSGYRGNGWTNPDRDRRMKVYWQFDEKIELHFILFDSQGGELGRVHVMTLPPSLGALEDVTGRGFWNSPKQFAMESKRKDRRWVWNILEPTIRFEMDRATRDPHGAYDLGLMLLEGKRGAPKNRELAIEWLKRSAEAGFKRATKKLIELGIE